MSDREVLLRHLRIDSVACCALGAIGAERVGEGALEAAWPYVYSKRQVLAAIDEKPLADVIAPLIEELDRRIVEALTMRET